MQVFDNWCITEHTDAKLLYLTDMCFQAQSALSSGCVTSASGFRDLMVVNSLPTGIVSWNLISFVPFHHFGWFSSFRCKEW